MLYVVLDELLDHYGVVTEHLEDDIEQMEERALHDDSDAFVEDLVKLKRYVFAAGRLADQHREVVAGFVRPDFPFEKRGEIEPYFRDIEASHARLVDRLSAAGASVNGAFDIYVSRVSHRTNHVMKVLTVVSTVLLPATLVLGVFGTSFEGVAIYSRTGFWAMLALMVLISGSILLAFRRRRWL